MSCQRPSFFVLPESSNVPSGGNLYNQFFIDALRAKNQSVQEISWSDFLNSQAPGDYFVDTLFMADLATVKEASAGQNRFLILHHLESLFPPKGISPDRLFQSKEKKILDQFKGFLATSSFSKEYLIQRAYAEEQIFVIPPALCFEPPKGKREVEQIKALIVANLVERKGILEFIEIFNRYKERPQDFQLKIIGSTEIEPEYARLCKEKLSQNSFLSNRIHFLGAVDPSEMVNHYAWSNLLISAAAMETFGMAIQEALASGVPVLCIRGGYSEEHIQIGETGFSYSSIPELVDGFIKLSKEQSVHQKLCEQLFQKNTLAYTWEHAAELFIQAMKRFNG